MTIESDGDFDLIRSNPIEGETPAELATGNDDDDQVLRQLAARASLDRPRRWRHYLYVPTEEWAQMVARPLIDTGWEAEIWAPDEGEDHYTVIAELDGVVLTGSLVRSTRELFEDIISHIPGGEYDGWEAEARA